MKYMLIIHTHCEGETETINIEVSNLQQATTIALEELADFICDESVDTIEKMDAILRENMEGSVTIKEIEEE